MKKNKRTSPALDKKIKQCSCAAEIEELKERVRKLERHINITSGVYGNSDCAK